MLDSGQIFVLLAVFSGVYLLQKFVEFRRTVQSIANWVGFRTLFSGITLYIPFRVRGLSPGPFWSLHSKHWDFAEAGWDIVSVVYAFPKAGVDFYVADPVIAKEVLNARARFPKAVETYDVLATFGSNILVTEGEEWKNQRKIAAPAFSEKNNRLVWDETVNIIHDIFQNVWGDKDVVDVDHVMDLTVPVTLLVIGAAGFGRRISWNEDSVAPPGHSMTFKDALYTVTHRLFFKIMFPSWMLRWGTPSMRHFYRAYGELEKHIAEMIHARRTGRVREERSDLFNNLLDANDQHDGEAKLSDSELVGNVFLFLVAGYETTAHTLAFAFILLALYPEEQEAFYQNIKTVLPAGQEPTYNDFNRLTYSVAVLNETIRLFPPVIDIPKTSAEDTTFLATNAAGEQRAVPIPRGARILISTPSVHHNPKYWDDPETFKPSRFLQDYSRDAFLGFSAGPRGCIGRRFAEMEAVVVLTFIMLRYKVEVRGEPQFAGETSEQRKERLLKIGFSITIYPARAPLVFKRR